MLQRLPAHWHPNVHAWWTHSSTPYSDRRNLRRHLMPLSLHTTPHASNLTSASHITQWKSSLTTFVDAFFTLRQTPPRPPISPSCHSPSSWTPPNRRSSAGRASGTAASQQATHTQHHRSPLCVCALRCPLLSYQAAALRLPVVAGSIAPHSSRCRSSVPPPCLSVGRSPVMPVCHVHPTASDNVSDKFPSPISDPPNRTRIWLGFEQRP